MHIFVTGASGYIGSAVTKALLERGHTVTGLARSEEAAQKISHLGAQVTRGDFTQPQDWVSQAQQADGVINIASAMSFDGSRGAIEMKAIQALIDVLKGTGKTLLYTSDQLIYGPTTDQPATEETPLNPLPFVNWRPDVEQAVLRAPGMRALVIRPAAVVGHSTDHLMPLLIQLAKQNGESYYVGDGTSRWSLIHVDDLAQAYADVFEKAPGGTVVNVTADDVSMQELAESVAEAAGVDRHSSLPLEQAIERLGPWAANFANSLIISARKVEQVVGWKPKRVPIRAHLFK